MKYLDLSNTDMILLSKEVFFGVFVVIVVLFFLKFFSKDEVCQNNNFSFISINSEDLANSDRETPWWKSNGNIGVHWCWKYSGNLTNSFPGLLFQAIRWKPWKLDQEVQTWNNKLGVSMKPSSCFPGQSAHSVIFLFWLFFLILIFCSQTNRFFQGGVKWERRKGN